MNAAGRTKPPLPPEAADGSHMISSTNQKASITPAAADRNLTGEKNITRTAPFPATFPGIYFPGYVSSLFLLVLWTKGSCPLIQSIKGQGGGPCVLILTSHPSVLHTFNKNVRLPLKTEAADTFKVPRKPEMSHAVGRVELFYVQDGFLWPRGSLLQ